jgi:hypothetical protein
MHISIVHNLSAKERWQYFSHAPVTQPAGPLAERLPDEQLHEVQSAIDKYATQETGELNGFKLFSVNEERAVFFRRAEQGKGGYLCVFTLRPVNGRLEGAAHSMAILSLPTSDRVEVEGAATTEALEHVQRYTEHLEAAAELPMPELQMRLGLQ